MIKLYLKVIYKYNFINIKNMSLQQANTKNADNGEQNENKDQLFKKKSNVQK